MPKTITLGRWRIDIYERAFYLQRQPDPRCGECRGGGSVETSSTGYFEPCGCWDPFRSLRIPFGRTVITERYPF